ncbi:hypothetical protein BOX15_Mlig004865g1, partial [Macrostomum lignano]
VDYNACLLDGPDLRGALLDQERMLDDSVKSMKRVIDSFNRVRETGLSHSEALLAFGRAISELGAGSSDSTDAGKPSSSVGALKAEREMASFFVQLSQDLEYIEEARRRWLANSQRLFVDELNSQRAKIKAFLSDTRREYYEETRRFYHNQERALAKAAPQERDMDVERIEYFGRTYEYVKALQFRQAMNKSRFFEIIASLQSVWKCFYQECNDNLGDREQQMHHMNKSVMLFNSSVESAEKELDENKQQLLSSQLLPASLRTSSGQHEGYLLLAQKKLGIPTSWQRCYCTLILESRHISLQPYSPANPAGSSAAAAPISGFVSSVTEDTSSGRKFTFEVATIEGRSLLLQAYSNSNFRAWVQALSGQRGSVSDEQLPGQADADRLIACLRSLESRGLQEEGLYRVEGQNREVEELLQSFVLGGSPCNLETVGERVLSTCIKRYLKRLPQPLLTFDFVEYLINSSDPANDSQSHRPLAELRDRLSTDKLPAVNRRLLAELLQHLRRVADQSTANRMPADNLAMVFAPTLCWPRQMNLQSVQLCAVEGKQLLLLLMQKAEELLPDLFQSEASPTDDAASPSSDVESRAPVLRQASGDDIIESANKSGSFGRGGSRLHQAGQLAFSLADGPRCCARTLYPCTADAEGDLSFSASELVYDVHRIDGVEGWCCGVIGGRRGIIPLNYVQML